MSAPLVVVQNDAVWTKVRRNCRFSIPRECAATAQQISDEGLESYPHLRWYVEHYQELAIDRLAKLGFKHDGEAFDLVGPMEHMIFSLNTDPDPGLFQPPQVTAMDVGDGQRLLSELERHERAQKALRSKALGEEVELVDYELVGGFLVRESPSFRSSNFPLGTAVIDPKNPPSPDRLRNLKRYRPEFSLRRYQRGN